MPAADVSGSSDGDDEQHEPEWARFNQPNEKLVTQQVCGYDLTLQQDPDSQHLGLTVWDASIVLANYLEKQSLKKGALSKARLQGRRLLEVGSGTGLAGMAAALLGCHVTLTDVADVLPLLRANVAANFETAAWAAAVTLRAQFGSLQVRELDWTKPEQLEHYDAAFDYIIGTDCVYHEDLLCDLLRVLLHCSDTRTTLIICNELRSESVNTAFQSKFSGHYHIKAVSQRDLHEDYRSVHIRTYTLKRRKAPLPDAYTPPAEGVHTGVPGPST